MTSRAPCNTHPEEGINPAKFDVSTTSSFEGVKTDRHTDRIALYMFCCRFSRVFYDDIICKKNGFLVSIFKYIDQLNNMHFVNKIASNL